MSNVQETIFAIIAKESGVEASKITLESTLKDLEIDSLDAVQIIFELEDKFKITLPDRDPTVDTDSVLLRVEDDGCGMGDSDAGMGLVHMRERLAAVGGSITLPGNPDGGCTLVAIVPVAS